MHSAKTSDFVSDGYCNLVKAIDEEVRRTVDARYADEWYASGLFKRWRLQRKMDREVQAIVSEAVSKVSSKALF